MRGRVVGYRNCISRKLGKKITHSFLICVLQSSIRSMGKVGNQAEKYHQNKLELKEEGEMGFL